jgi:hypothetical protein
MHKYEEQSVPYGGTHAQGISDSIHKRHIVCLFDVTVQSRCRKMYAVHRAGRNARGSLARSVHGQLGSARIGSFEFFSLAELTS